MKPHQLGVTWVFLCYEEDNGWDVLHPRPQSNVRVDQVYFAKCRLALGMDQPQEPVVGCGGVLSGILSTPQGIGA